MTSIRVISQDQRSKICPLSLSSMDYSNTQRFILAFKAGRALRRDGTNFVDPKPEKGAIILYEGEDDLLRFVWKDRTTGNVGEVRTTRATRRRLRWLGRLLRRSPMQELIMFDGDASFTQVSDVPEGRTYVLKFQSSDQRHFVSPTQSSAVLGCVTSYE